MTVYSVGKWAAVIQRYTHQYIDKRFNHFGLGNTEVLVLLTLYDQENVPQEYITRQIVMDKATITRAIKRLEEKGYLYRKESVSDRREKIVFLSEAAWKIEKEISEAMREWRDIMTKEFTEEEKHTLLRLMERAAEGARAEVESG
ncbi:MarR family winged helix-turn-helix transcriptional regulator [Marinococcus luteus]|uniref:MarR family winged helix-turn-helix transcriptional regulator n=1 Tax=Marinococcus luteus TaxID=1122204 RepID=UPI002ACCF63E|nr:MarR family transcriptional regulator [Marinococcus luteus]MDZ5782591.1 MarR family transcriptional regulator [Marinococcus luteus]